MDIDIKSCLDNLDIKYDLNEDYINELFLLIRQMLKPLYNNYMLKKKLYLNIFMIILLILWI